MQTPKKKLLNVSRKSYALDVFSAQQGEYRLYVGSHYNEVQITLSVDRSMKFEFQGTLAELLERLK